MSKVRTRFAPSPTGYLHLGSARTTLFTSLFAKSHDGVWFLRVEDTDQKRLMPDAFNNLLMTLYEVGLIPDEGVSLDQHGVKDSFYGFYHIGDFQPYVQSQRLDIYHPYAQQMIDRKLAYWDFLTDDERGKLQEVKNQTKRPISYFNENLKNYSEFLYLSMDQGLGHFLKPALRFRFQRDTYLKCHDLLLGSTVFDLRLEEDPVIIKSDGYPTYHFAHLIDDHTMKTTHVIRGQEWYSSFPMHVQMFEDFFGYRLDYIHIPYVMGEEGKKKMSKRDGNVNMKKDYLEKGYLPEALLNYLAFLGWNPGTDKEFYLTENDFKN